MKKVLWILIIIILFIGGWFVFVVKNPSLPIAQTILTSLGLSSVDTQQEVPPPTSTGIDLSNCISYFDGCNTCMVSGGVVWWCTRMACQTLTEPSCLQYATTWAETTTGVVDENTWTTTTYTNTQYWLSFDYPNNRIIATEIGDDPADCSLKFTVHVADPSKTLQCFEPNCVPSIQPNINVYIRKTTSCTWFSSTCSGLDQSTQAVCQQLKNLWIPEATAAKTLSLWGLNGSDYVILQGTYGYIVRWIFSEGINTVSRAFLLEKNGYGVQIFDDVWMYTHVFDEFVKTFNYN
jgi:hypothetical protein